MPKFKVVLFIAGLSSLLVLSACSSTKRSAYVGNTETLEGLQALGRAGQQDMNELKSNIRVLAIKETALTIGAQSGLASRAKHINSYLIRHARRLDQVYDFVTLMLENNVIPPILSEGHNLLNLASPNAIRVADTSYKIDQQARFLTTPPTWRQYIWMDYNLPERPPSAVLPKDNLEREAWDKYTYEGWQKGMEQADSIFADNLARLKHDFMGIVLYRKLLAMNMVSPPYVSHTDLGITGDTESIRVDDRVLRIVALPQLNIKGSEWRASVTRLDDRLKKYQDMEKLAEEVRIEITDRAWQPVVPKAE